METQIYTVADVAKMTGCSRRTIVRVFERERGVLILKKSKRRTLRIPRPVYERVIKRLSVP